MAAAQVMIDMEKLIKSMAFEYIDRIRSSYNKSVETVKKLPTSEEISEGNEKWEHEDSVAEYMKACSGVEPGDEDAMKFKLYDIFYKQYERKNQRFEYQLKKRRKVALANLE